MMSKNEESACYCQYKRFKILKGGIASPSDVCWGKETENILGGFWQLPELVSCQHVAQTQGDSLQMPSMGHRRG